MEESKSPRVEEAKPADVSPSRSIKAELPKPSEDPFAQGTDDDKTWSLAPAPLFYGEERKKRLKVSEMLPTDFVEPKPDALPMVIPGTVGGRETMNRRRPVALLPCQGAGTPGEASQGTDRASSDAPRVEQKSRFRLFSLFARKPTAP
jgi:hypothetical protein